MFMIKNIIDIRVKVLVDVISQSMVIIERVQGHQVQGVSYPIYGFNK